MKRIILFVFLLSVGLQAFGQRTYEGQYELSASGSVFTDEGVSLQFGRYTHNGYWDVVALAHYYDEYSAGVSALDNSNVGDWLVGGGYMFRLVGTRERTLSLYGGVDGLVGYEKVQRWYENGYVGDTVENVSALAFGVSPKVEAEVFPFRKLAAVVSFAVPMNFLSNKSVVRMSAGVGLRYCF